jgi:hypothetical protein
MRHPELFLLQGLGLGDFKLQPNPVQGILFFAGVTITVLLVVFINKSSKIRNSKVFKSGAVNKPQLRISGFKDMKDAARKYALDYVEQKFLLDLFDKEGVNILSVFSSIENTDKEFSRLIQILEKDENTDNDIAKLFAIRNKMEYYLSADEYPKKSPDSNLTVRRYKRAEVNIPVVFCLVIVKEIRDGLKKIKKLSPDSKKYEGTIIDISSGGCAINTRNPFKTGARIKLEFKIGRNNLAALALILRINHNRNGSVLHTRFLKIPVKSLNAINTLVYNYRNF